jgi:hypothetical protein
VQNCYLDLFQFIYSDSDSTAVFGQLKDQTIYYCHLSAIISDWEVITPLAVSKTLPHSESTVPTYVKYLYITSASPMTERKFTG